MSLLNAHHNEIALTDAAGADLAGELRRWNAAHGADAPALWRIVVATDTASGWGEGPAVWLDAGLAGDQGALRWVAHDVVAVPAANAAHLGEDRWQPYASDASGYPCRVHAALLASAEQVLAAVADLTAVTGPPTGLDWSRLDWTRVEDGHALIAPVE